MTNPFRQRDRARLYDAMVKEYRERGPVLFYPHLREEPLNTNVLRHPGNSWAGWFWRGFADSLRRRCGTPARSSNSPTSVTAQGATWP